MKKLNIDWTQLELAFDPTLDPGVAYRISNYLDTQTGGVLLIDGELSNATEEIIEELGGWQNGETWTVEDAEGTEAYENMTEWLKPRVLDAFQILYSVDRDRFEEVPRFTQNQCFHGCETLLTRLRMMEFEADLMKP